MVAQNDFPAGVIMDAAGTLCGTVGSANNGFVFEILKNFVDHFCSAPQRHTVSPAEGAPRVRVRSSALGSPLRISSSTMAACQTIPIL